MPWEIGKQYRWEDIVSMFPGLAPRGTMARSRDAADQYCLVLLRENRPGYRNWFAGRTIVLEINTAAREKNALLRSSDVEKVLFWSERGGTYVCLGLVSFLKEQGREAGVGPLSTLAIVDANVPVPLH